MGEGSCTVWFGAPGLRVLDHVDDGHEVTIDLESIVAVVGCTMCGTRARAKDRRWVTVRDAPNRAIVLRIRKRIWSCPEPDCAAKTWTEHCDLVAPRHCCVGRRSQSALS